MSCSGRVRAAELLATTAALTLLLSGCGRGPRKAGGGRQPDEPGEKAGASAPKTTEPSGETPEEKAVKKSGAAHLSADGFEKSIEKGVALVDFWAQWCPPCLKQGPIVDKIAADYQGRALVGKVNVDEARELAGKLRIQAIPTVILFRDGKEVQRLVGLNSEKGLRAELERALGGN